MELCKVADLNYGQDGKLLWLKLSLLQPYKQVQTETFWVLLDHKGLWPPFPSDWPPVKILKFSVLEGPVNDDGSWADPSHSPTLHPWEDVKSWDVSPPLALRGIIHRLIPRTYSFRSVCRQCECAITNVQWMSFSQILEHIRFVSQAYKWVTVVLVVNSIGSCVNLFNLSCQLRAVEFKCC